MGDGCADARLHQFVLMSIRPGWAWLALQALRVMPEAGPAAHDVEVLRRAGL